MTTSSTSDDRADGELGSPARPDQELPADGWTAHTDPLVDDPRFDAAAGLLIPVGLAVAAWLTVLIAVGALARVGSASLLSIIPLFLVGFLFWPLYRVKPWAPGVSARVRRWVARQRRVLGVTLGLALVRFVPFAPDPLVALLNFPFRIVGVMYGVGLYYGRVVAPWFGDLLVSFGQWYFVVLWLYVLAGAVVWVARRLR